MDLKKWTTVIPILSVAVMLIWGLIAKDWSKCWIAVVVGGAITAVINVMAKDDNGKEKK